MKQILFILSIAFFFPPGVRAQSRAPLPPLEVKLVLSVDWEGFSLDESNLQAFNQFRNDYPQIKLIHFLSAAYFTKPGVDPIEVAAKIRSVMRAGDEFGLHIHAFESLLAAAGVKFRDHETYWGAKASRPLGGERGHDVPLSLFTMDEMRKLIRTSLSILGKNGFDGIQSFRAGGWIATPEVLEALAREGVRVDSSAVSADVVGLVAGPEQPLYRINKQLWPEQTHLKYAPYEIQTHAGAIMEFPNNIALADYIDGARAFRLFESLVQNYYGKTPVVFFHYGFHQETAHAYLTHVRQLLHKVQQFTQKYRVQVSSVTFSDVLQRPWVQKARGNLFCAQSLK